MRRSCNFKNLTCANYASVALYGGLTLKVIKARKGLMPVQNLFAYMDYSELAANYFLVTQTEGILRKKGLLGIDESKQVYQEVGGKVRQVIKELGNIMPEDLPLKEHITSD